MNQNFDKCMEMLLHSGSGRFCYHRRSTK